MSMQAIIKRKRESRRGRGFSREELNEVNLTFKQALKMQIPIDIRRSTKHEENVKTLKTHLSTPITKGSPKDVKQKAKDKAAPATLNLTDVKGIGPKLSEKLIKGGVKRVNELASSSPEKIAKMISVSEERASVFIENARSLVNNNG